ncbi:MAG: prepilin peptidase [Acidobacteriaceae bacterium]|nr:prepilin peptidase [Acidobacteriaceae bacterium]
MPPEYLPYYVIAAGLFGLLLGSFLNVCIYRIPRDISVVTPRSFCPECGKPVAWHDNIPLASYLLLRGRCRYCTERIGWRYPLVELTTALLFAIIAAGYGWHLAALKWMTFEALLIVLFWTDFEEQILPDEFTIGGTLIGAILAIFVTVPSLFGQLFFPQWKPVARSLFNAALGAVVLSLPLWLLGVLYARIRKREGLGFGDVKLLMLFGVFLGLEKGLQALMIGAVAGSVFGIIYLFVTRSKASETALPFGSFLCAGAALVPLFR